jgi:serine/threonine-protein phosphatase 2A catalytic subunit
MNFSAEIDEWICRLMRCESLNETEILILTEKAKEILIEEENVKRVELPVTICGDIHGHFYDMVEMFKLTGTPPDVNWLFLGDYVDRGYYSIECLCLLLCFKVKYPGQVTLLRGNHECRVITQVFILDLFNDQGLRFL